VGLYERETEQHKRVYSFTRDLRERNDQYCKVYLLSDENSSTEESLRLRVNCDVNVMSTREEFRRRDFEITILLCQRMETFRSVLIKKKKKTPPRDVTS
jgi:hypothetical protein